MVRNNNNKNIFVLFLFYVLNLYYKKEKENNGKIEKHEFYLNVNLCLSPCYNLQLLQ